MIKIKLLAAAAALIALPAVAQPQASREAAAMDRGPQKVEAKAAKPKADGKVSAEARGKSLKAQDKPARKSAKPRAHPRNVAPK